MYLRFCFYGSIMVDKIGDTLSSLFENFYSSGPLLERGARVSHPTDKEAVVR